MPETKTISRRASLKAVGGGLMLNTIPFTNTTSQQEVRITTVKRGTEPVERKSVPADWWSQVQATRNVQRQLESTYLSSNFVQDVAVGVAPQTRSGRRTLQVNIYVDGEKGTPHSIPEQINGITVRTREHEPSEPIACHQKQYNTVPGGVINGPDWQGYGTSTHRVFGSEGETSYLLTAAHIFDDNGCDLTDLPVYQYGQKMGKIVDHDGALDYAIVAKTSDANISGFDDRIEGANWGPVDGHVTRDGVTDLASTETEIYKMGTSTCRTSGVIKEEEKTLLNTCGNGSTYLRYTCNAEGGDSGGPVYAEKTSNIDGSKYIATIGLCTTAVMCSSAYGIHNATGYIFT